MEKFVITGGTPLLGEVEINGAKNAVLGILAGTLLVDGVCRIENVPDISDVAVILRMLECFGAKIERPDSHTIVVDAKNIEYAVPDYELVRKIRGSYYLIGALLSRFKKAEIAMPGGCNFGTRPIDLHIKGFEALGATIDTGADETDAPAGTTDTTSDCVIKATADKLTGTSIYLDKVSVGATINIMLAACKA